MLELWLVRHGETVWNASRRWQGHSDVPLSDVGRAQALRLRRPLGDLAFDAVWTSDLARARETAEIALPGTPLSVDERLREMHFGRWEGRTFAELSPEDQARLQMWVTDPTAFGAPAGETWGEMMDRVSGWAGELPPAGRMAVFVHGGTIRAYLHAVARVLDDLERPFVVHNCSLSRVVHAPDGVQVLSINETAHLEEPETA